MFYSIPSEVIKLNLNPKTRRLEFVFDFIPFTKASNPLSRILLCPIYKNYNLGWVVKILSAIDLAPSYPILLLKTFKYFKLLLFLRDFARASAPETPMLHLLRSRTSSRSLCGITVAKSLTPSLSILFLDRSKTFN